jgi:FixJ family two-component response regulator
VLKVKELIEQADFEWYKELTNREQEVLILLLENKSYDDIAKEIFISGTTLRTHRNNIFQKIAPFCADGLEFTQRSNVIAFCYSEILKNLERKEDAGNHVQASK